MQYQLLPTTSIKVSKACLGTMSFGAHVDEQTAIKTMDQAVDLGINFFDTAELYSIPPSKETYGLTEEIIERWLKKRNNRDQIILATKVVGPSCGVRDGYIRDGQTGLDRQNIRKALEGSLKRLGVDYIDLYQAHWPDRKVNMFGERGYTHEQNDQSVDLAETLEAMQELQKEGKIRYFGVSNETPWGVMKYLELHKDRSLPRVVTIQNNYSLLTRTYDTHLAEVSHREDVGLLAYSPLGFGVLGGRYLDGRLPKGGRFTKYPYFAERYRSAEVEKIIKKYLVVAKKHNLSLAKLALAFVYSRPFVTSNIIGPSNPEQLIECVEALDIKLNSEILADIETVHEECPNPCP